MALPEKITGALSENLLTLLSQSDEFGKLVVNFVEPELFEGELRVMAERIIKYWHAHNQAPKLHTADLFDDILSDPRNRRAPMYRRTLSSMLQLAEGINAEYVLDQLKTFTRMQKLKDAILRSAEILNQPQETTIPQVEEILYDILRARDFAFDPGISLADYDVVIAHMQRHYAEFDTGIKTFDRNNIVPNRGALFMLLGTSGVGKTWGMVHLGKRALLQRKKVLHVTPELSAEDTMLRYYMAIFGAAKFNDGNIESTLLKVDRDNRLIGLVREPVEPDFDFASAHLREKLETKVGQWERRLGDIRIKQVAPRAMTVEMLEGFLDSLESANNFVPDMLIVDSAYLLKVDMRQEYRIGLGRMYERLRGIGVERKIAVVASHQLSRQAADARRAKLTHIAEDWSIIQTADIAVTHSATKAEQRFGLARLYADKVRSDKSDLGVVMAQNYAVGQYCLDSHRLPAAYWEMLDHEFGEGWEREDGEADNGTDGG